MQTRIRGTREALPPQSRFEDELRRRCGELEARCPHALTQHDRRELAALNDLLKLSRKEIEQ